VQSLKTLGGCETSVSFLYYMDCGGSGGAGAYEMNCTQYTSASWTTTCPMGYSADPTFGGGGGGGITDPPPPVLTAAQIFINS